MRQWLILAALVAAPWRLSAACGVNGQMVNGFESATSACPGEVNDVSLWTPSGTGQAGLLVTMSPGTTASTTLSVPEGTNLGVLDWSQGTGAVKQAWINLPAASFESPTNFAAYDYLYMQYSTTTTSGSGGANYWTTIYLTPTAGATQGFQVPGNNVSTGAWTPMVVALNYARNMGMTLGSLLGMRVQESTSTNPGGYGTVYFDDLALTTTAQDVPNSQIASGISPSVVACSSVQLSWGAATQDGTDPIAGYHVYRSTVSASGPWTSRAYVAFGTNTYTDPSVPATATVYYVVLPYAATTSAFEGAPGNFTLMFGDPAAPTTGVNEALINPADAVSVSNPQSGCSPTPSPSPTQSQTFTPTPSPSATPTSSFTDSPTPSDTPTVTLTSTPTPSYTDTSTPAPPSATATQSPAFTATITPSFTVSVTPTTPSPTPSITPSPTASPTFATFGPTPTLNVAVPAQLFPNPYHADQGLFHLGNVLPGLDVSIYDMIGQKVRSFTTVGNPLMDTWDGNNANGVKVVTGVYFVVIQGNVYRLAVVRGQ